MPNSADRLPLIAILRGITPDEVVDHAIALIHAGFTALEVPTNSPDWAESVRRLQNDLPSSVQIGAGTVITQAHLEELIQLGGSLMVTPNVNPALIQQAKQHGITTCIGIMTPSEAFLALESGADILKVFPAKHLGMRYAQALRAVLPTDTQVYAVGGVTPDNLREFIAGGYHGAGLGTDLYRAGQSVAQTADQAQAFVQAWRSLQP